MDNCITISQKRNQTYYTSPLEVLDGSINLNVKTFLKIDHRGFPGGSVVKSPPAMQETSPGPGRPYVPWDKQALTPQVLSPRTTTAAAVPSKPVPAPRAQPKEKPALHNQRAAPVAVTRENPVQQRRSSLAKNKINF